MAGVCILCSLMLNQRISLFRRAKIVCIVFALLLMQEGFGKRVDACGYGLRIACRDCQISPNRLYRHREACEHPIPSFASSQLSIFWHSKVIENYNNADSQCLECHEYPQRDRHTQETTMQLCSVTATRKKHGPETLSTLQDSRTSFALAPANTTRKSSEKASR